jgi:hypothetical protein
MQALTEQGKLPELPFQQPALGEEVLEELVSQV